MYRAYQIYLVLIKVDLFFFVGFSIQFIYLTLTRRNSDPEYWLTIIILPATIPILYTAIYAVRHESRKWMAAFLTTMVAGVVYFIYKIVRMYYGEKVPVYKGVNVFLTLFGKPFFLGCLHSFLDGISLISLPFHFQLRGVLPNKQFFFLLYDFYFYF
jgi:hypothetical protein